MFQLLTIEDTIELQPQQLDNVEASLYAELKKRYERKVRNHRPAQMTSGSTLEFVLGGAK